MFYRNYKNKIHFYSHLELDGSSSVTLSDPDTLSVSPLEIETRFSLNDVEDDTNYTNEMQHVEKGQFG